MREFLRRWRGRSALVAALAFLAAPALIGCADDGPPNIPHTLTGRSECLSCHGTPGSGAPQVPSDHAGRTNDMCLGCHS